MHPPAAITKLQSLDCCRTRRRNVDSLTGFHTLQDSAVKIHDAHSKERKKK